MTKRISLIAVVVCGFAAVCGLVFGGNKLDLFKDQNGPGLISDRFFMLIRNTESEVRAGDVLVIPMKLPQASVDFVMIRRINPNSKDDISGIYSSNNGTYSMQTGHSTNMANEHDDIKLEKNLTLKEVNRKVDAQFFPNVKMRKKEKRIIMKKLEELNKQ